VSFVAPPERRMRLREQKCDQRSAYKFPSQRPDPFLIKV
jgi:hypothetical protein